VQVHPFKPLVLHIDFQRVDARTKLHMKVPLHYSNAEESQAVKHDNCVVNHVMSEVDISCLPADLPEFIDVDLSGMKKGMSLHLNDIKLPKGVTAVPRGKPNPVLVSVVTIGGEEVAEPGAADAAAVAAAPVVAEAKAPAAKGGDAKAPAGKAGDAKAADAKAAPAKASAAKKK
jgi:large subunit ribosomal protein L25